MAIRQLVNLGRTHRNGVPRGLHLAGKPVPFAFGGLDFPRDGLHECWSACGAQRLELGALVHGKCRNPERRRDDTAFQIVSLARDNMARDALKLAIDYDFTVIDGPPHAEEVARSCIIASDFVALPIEPSGLSTWASDLTVKQVQEAQEYKGSLKCGFVVSRKIGNTVIGRQIRVMAAEGGMPILVAEVGNRVPFAESLTMGQSIFEWAPKSVAAHEIQSLTREILSYGEEEFRNRAQAG